MNLRLTWNSRSCVCIHLATCCSVMKAEPPLLWSAGSGMNGVAWKEMSVTVQKRGEKRPEEVFWFGWHALLGCSRGWFLGSVWCKLCVETRWAIYGPLEKMARCMLCQWAEVLSLSYTGSLCKERPLQKQVDLIKLGKCLFRRAVPVCGHVQLDALLSHQPPIQGFLGTLRRGGSQGHGVVPGLG